MERYRWCTIDIFVAGVGTGGTLIGVSSELKTRKPHLKCIAVEPENSSVLSGNELPRSKLSRYHQRNPSLIATSSGVFNSFIPIRFAIGIRSTYIFQFTFPLEAGKAIFEI